MLRRILMVLVIGLLMVWARSFYGSRQAYHQAAACLKAGQIVNAVAYFDRSIRWYTPLNPYARLSAQRLWDIGRQAEHQGNVRLALIALRTLSRGSYVSGHLWEPGREWIQKCRVKIDELMAFESSGSGSVKGTGSLDPFGRHTDQPDRNPSTRWSIVVLIGFLGWIGSIIGWIMLACKGNGKPRLSSTSTLVWTGMTLVFFAFWILGMCRA